MRILILSDIHANLEALDACLEAAPEYDTVYNLGDIVGYGANPNETTQRSRELGSVFVRGNHDKVCSGVSSLEGFNPIAALAVIWTQEQLTSEHLHFLHGMPRGPLTPLENLEIVHGSPRDEDEYVLYPRDAFSILARTAAPLVFFGHTHVQGGYWIDDAQEDQGLIQPQYSGAGSGKVQLDLKREAKYLINPGSVGQPRDGDPRAAFALYDSEQSSVTFYRVPYDIETAQKKIFDAGLPERLAIRLAEGR